ncbi:MAG TPA: carboxypeptidase regulatory-like domain-containing protein [bacterium]
MRDFTLYLIFALTCLTAPRVLAQPDTLWSARVTATGNPAIYSAINHSSGDLILVGETNPGLPSSNFLISRLSPAGAVVWTRTFGGSSNDAAYSCVELPDGNLVVAGGFGGNAIQLMALSTSGDSLWSRAYANGTTSTVCDITLLHDGTIAVVGTRLASDTVRSDLWLLKCTASGDTVWTRVFGGSNSDIGYRISERPDRSLLMTGYSRSNGARDYDFWLLHTDSLGNPLTSTLYGSSGPDMCYDFADGDSVVYLAGKTTIASANRGYLAKANGAGDSLWARSYTHGGVEEQLRGIVAQESGEAICAGWSGPSWNDRQCWLFAITPDGSESWQWVYGPAASGFYGIIPVTAGGYLAFGQISEANVRKGYAVRLSLSQIRGSVVEWGTGAVVASARVDIGGTTQYVITDAHGEFRLGIVNGTYDLTVSGSCISRDTLRQVVVPPDSFVTADFHVRRPHVVWLESSISTVVHNHVRTTLPLHIVNSGNGAMDFGIIAQPVRPAGPWLSVTPDTTRINAGDTLTVQVEIAPDTTDDGTHEFYGNLLVRTNSCPGSTETIPVTAFALNADGKAALSPQNFSLAAYPNPFNPRTTLTLSVPQAARITLSIYDITGRCVAVLTDQPFAPGTYLLPFDAGSLPSGLYFARVESALFTSTRKLMLLK